MSVTLLVDGPNLVMRSLHAAMHPHGAMMTAEGVDTGALTLFINSLGALVREEAPARMAIAWDSPEKGFRHQLHEGYKANRVPPPSGLDAKQSTFDLVHAFCDLANIQNFTVASLEADDIIASWWHTATAGPLLIASADHDFLQLAGPNPQGVNTEIARWGHPQHWTAERVAQEYDSPAHYPLIAALAGDSSDNIPGIRGIGPKKAIKLLANHDWDLESALDEHPSHREEVRAFYEMINLRDVVYPQLPQPTPVIKMPDAELLDFLASYKMKRAIQQLQAGTFWQAIPYRR